MGRLIDADDFIERMENDTDLCAEMEKDGLKALKKYLDMQPTAYDVNAVVNQLEQKMKRARDKERENTSEYFEGEADGFEFAIEIVKGEVN